MFESRELADLVVADLIAEFGVGDGADATFLSVDRGYLPVRDLKVEDKPRVIVCPGNQSHRRVDRRRGRELVVDVAIQQKLSGREDDERDRGLIDELIETAGSVFDFLCERHQQPNPTRSYLFQGGETDPLFSTDALVHRREFLSALGFTYLKTGR